jgi:hypothetical protein
VHSSTLQQQWYPGRVGVAAVGDCLARVAAAAAAVLQITPARLDTGGGDDDVSTSSAAAAAAASGASLHVVVRHQGKPIRPECYPMKKINKAAPAKPKLQPKILKDAKGRPLAMPMKTRTAPVYGPGKTAIKLTGAAGARTANSCCRRW